MKGRVEIVPGYAVTRLIKGGWQLAGGHGPVEREDALRDMSLFVEAGISTFDCADIYTGVEELIGEFLRRRRARLGTAEPVRVHTKFVPDLRVLPGLSRADVERAIDRSLARLGVERLDLVQFHWWDYEVPRWVEIAGLLADLQGKGKIRHLGATNFDVPAFTALLDAGIPIVALQVQYSLIDRRPEHGMAALCRERGVSLFAYGALLGGFLSERWLGAAEPQAPFENRSLAKYKLILDEFGSWAAFQGVLRAAQAVASRHRVGIGSVGLAWVLTRPQAAAVIVGARGAHWLRSVLCAPDLAMDEDDLGTLEASTRAGRGPRGDIYELERVKGGRHAAIMRYDLNQAAAGAGGR